MSDESKKEKSLEDRVKSLEHLQRNTRIAIIILVGYSIYDVISKDSGSEIVYAHKVNARVFELIDGQGTVFGSWKAFDAQKKEAGLVIENNSGKQLRLSAEQIQFMQGRVNPSPLITLNEDGVYKNSNQTNAGSDQ